MSLPIQPFTPHIGAHRAPFSPLLAEDGRERTKTDLITYAAQFLSASMTGGEKLFHSLSSRLSQRLPEIPKTKIDQACERHKEAFLKTMADLLASLPCNGQLVGHSQEVSQAYHQLTQRVQQPLSFNEMIPFQERMKAVLSTMSATLSSPLVFSQKLKSELVKAKAEILFLMKTSSSHFQKACTHLIQEPLFASLSDQERSHLLHQLEHDLSHEMNQERGRILLSSKEWDQRTETRFSFSILSRFKEREEHRFSSGFRAAGPAYPSQMPRNRTPDQMKLINFFFTSFHDRENSPLHLEVTATRSGTMTESNQTNNTVRHNCTIKNIEQLAYTHAQATLLRDDIPLQGAGTKEKPYLLPLTLITLLTPDFSVHLKTLLHKSPLADDGRRHLSDLLQIFDEYRKKPLVVQISGKWVQMDFRYYNLPSKNDYDERRASLFGSMLVHHTKSDLSIRENMKKLLLEATAYADSLMKDPLPLELLPLMRLLERKKELRQIISRHVMETKCPPSLEIKQEWTATNDQILDLIKRDIDDRTLTPILTKYLRGLLIQDLRDDLAELTSSQLYKDVQKMDGNRFGFGARLIMLSALLGQACHFSCNSGKDRTSLQDDELKLLMAETSLSCRLPAWFEQVGLRHHRINRKQVLEQAGNAMFNPKANIGHVAWLNLRGNRVTLPLPKSPEEQEEDRALNQAYDSIESASMITMKVEG